MVSGEQTPFCLPIKFLTKSPTGSTGHSTQDSTAATVVVTMMGQRLTVVGCSGGTRPGTFCANFVTKALITTIISPVLTPLGAPRPQHFSGLPGAAELGQVSLVGAHLHLSWEHHPTPLPVFKENICIPEVPNRQLALPVWLSWCQAHWLGPQQVADLGCTSA